MKILWEPHDETTGLVNVDAAFSAQLQALDISPEERLFVFGAWLKITDIERPVKMNVRDMTPAESMALWRNIRRIVNRNKQVQR